MLRLAIVFTLAVSAFAAGGCFIQKSLGCVSSGGSSCGGNVCFGTCVTTSKDVCREEQTSTKVCKDEIFCKEIATPCGNGGLTCGSSQECVSDRVCKIVPKKKKSLGEWGFDSNAGRGLVKVCKDKFSCAAVDPWAMDIDQIDVVCTKEFEIVEDTDCAGLIGNADLWGGTTMSEEKFLKMNNGFSCGEKLVGKIVCLEAEATVKVETCSNGLVCGEGTGCATKKVCVEEPSVKTVCSEVPVFTCTPGGPSPCGSSVCSPGQTCKVTQKKVCPTIQVVQAPVQVVQAPAAPQVIQVPGATPGGQVPGATPGGQVPGATPGGQVPGATPGGQVPGATPGSQAFIPAPVSVSITEAISASTDEGVVTDGGSFTVNGGRGGSSSLATNSFGDAAAVIAASGEGDAVVQVDTNAAQGGSAVATGGAEDFGGFP